MIAINIILITVNLIFALLSLFTLNSSFKLKFKLRFKFTALCLFLLFALNSYYLGGYLWLR